MPKIYFFQTNKYTITLVNQDVDRYLLISGFSKIDGSAYLVINSGNKINYAKFSYHPKEKRFQYAFTDELWTMLDRAGKGRPNIEKIKSKVVGLQDNQLLCTILIDGSSLFRKSIPVDRKLRIDFPSNKVFAMNFYLENNIPTVNHCFVNIEDNLVAEMETEREKIYSRDARFKSSEINGIAHLMNDFDFPWKMLCIGI